MLLRLRPVTYKLEFPLSMKRARNVLDVSKLKPATKPDINNNASINIDRRGNKDDEVIAILDKKREHKIYII